MLALGGLATLCLGALGGGRHAGSLSLTTLLGAGVLALATPLGEGPSVALDTGGLGRASTAFFCALTAVALLFLAPYGRRRGLAGDELFGLTLWACLGMALTSAATSWVILFLGYELLTLCLIVLTALRKTGRAAGEAGLKYFFVGAVGSAFLAFGIAVLYADTGTLEIAASVADSGAAAGPWARLGFAFLLTGIALKLSLAPFHLWTPDVYQGAPAPVTALLAAGAKVALFVALLRVSVAAGNSLWAVAGPVLSVFGVVTVVVGNVGALTQPRVKRLLAYSSVAQVGYLVLAAAAVHGGGAAAAAFYAVAYALADLGAFGLLGSLSSPDRPEDLDTLSDLRGLGYSHPWRAAALVACLLSLAGLPPLAGFVGKVAVFLAVFRAGLLWPGLLALATAVAAAYLYLRVVVTLYARPASPGGTARPIPEASLSERAVVGLVVTALLALGLAPSPLLTALARVFSALAPHS